MDFQASRTEAEAWLRAAYPDARISHDCVNADLCSWPTAPAGGPEDDSADYLRVDIRFEERDSAHVHVSGGTSNRPHPGGPSREGGPGRCAKRMLFNSLAPPTRPLGATAPAL
ncbi:hypothetical protein ACFW9N_40225 [Streptomyces sp. NPDC059496]|uniref:hypothetical protein n=1 Tax=Streptomyces sp. NPDC059496 TaxID=3346851 RepID=UPI003694F839